jgi:putative MFS transporter
MTMLAGAGVSLFGMVISIFLAPETRGLSLDKTSQMELY